VALQHILCLEYKLTEFSPKTLRDKTKNFTSPSPHHNPHQTRVLVRDSFSPAKVHPRRTMPTGEIEKPMIVDNRDGTISLKYEPKQEGCYEMQIKHNSEHILGSPYKFVVENTSKGLVTAFGP